jgi:hypothetical protein
MSAEVLRRAATLMRERANDIAPGRWVCKPSSDIDTSDTFVYGGRNGGVHMATTWCGDYIASWHPAVALAVAAWLDSAADHMDPDLALDGGYPDCEQDGALRLARAYLGEDA